MLVMFRLKHCEYSLVVCMAQHRPDVLPKRLGIQAAAIVPAAATDKRAVNVIWCAVSGRGAGMELYSAGCINSANSV